MSELYIGLMSGTSLDGIDTVLADLSAPLPALMASHYQPYDEGFRQQLASICCNGSATLDQTSRLDIRLGRLFANAIETLLKNSNTDPRTVRAIGSHGQTALHRPEGESPTSLQIGDPNIIALHTGITVIGDFRRRDIAAGGQGAPLVPAFHNAVFRSAKHDRAILNIGGIANLTVLPAATQQAVGGWDTGPGNTLMNGWILKHQGKDHDAGGKWASGGKILDTLLTELLSDDYFSLTGPKSTGPEYFNLDWLETYLKRSGNDIDPQDVQTTLCELTAISIALSLDSHAADCNDILVCGGGVHNDYLMQRLDHHLAATVRSTAEEGLNPDLVEALAFAWLAKQTLNHLPGNLPDATGASQPVILGGIYPA